MSEPNAEYFLRREGGQTSQKKEKSNGSGNLGVKGLVEWPEWDKADDRYLYIAGTSEAEFRGALSKPEVLNSKLHLLWVSCGKQDFLYQANRQFVDMLKSKGVKVQFPEMEGSHVWSVWRNNLNETAPMLFMDLRGKK